MTWIKEFHRGNLYQFSCYLPLKLLMLPSFFSLHYHRPSLLKEIIHVDHSVQDLATMDKNHIPSSPKFIFDATVDNVKEKESAKSVADIRALLDLNKLPFDEGRLHPDHEMHCLIRIMLKVMYPEFF